MTKTNYPGIDYGLGKTNVGENDIRFGVIPIHELDQWVHEDIEPHYVARCPACGDEDIAEDGDCEYACKVCGERCNDWEVYGGEPDSWVWIGDSRYVIEATNDCTELIILKSPYYSRSQFCSPCFPGGGYLMNPCDDGPKTYCLGHDQFDGLAKHPVYRVADDSRVRFYFT